jgi:hypothetical protein
LDFKWLIRAKPLDGQRFVQMILIISITSLETVKPFRGLVNLRGIAVNKNNDNNSLIKALVSSRFAGLFSLSNWLALSKRFDKSAYWRHIQVVFRFGFSSSSRRKTSS